MCTDDYQFRHSSATREKICRRFIFRTNDGNQRVFLVNISQFQLFGDLQLCHILLYLNKKGLNVKDFKFNLPKFDITIEAGDQCLIPFHFLTEKEQQTDMNDQKFGSTLFCSAGMGCKDCLKYDDDDISLKKESNLDYQNSPGEHLNAMNQSSESKCHQKKKQHEKTIQQALFRTKKWRMLHEVANFSLKNAAKHIGLSKKTLDDYFLVLRVGEQLGYNFVDNKQKKIGHLRSYIRNQPIKVKGRLSKTVKSFDLIPDPDINMYLPTKDLSKIIHVTEQKNSANSHSVPNMMQQESYCQIQSNSTLKKYMMEQQI